MFDALCTFDGNVVTIDYRVNHLFLQRAHEHKMALYEIEKN